MSHHTSTRQFRHFLFAVSLAWTGTCIAESSTTLGLSDAQQCYNESRLLSPGGGVEACTRALAEKNLNVHDMAATYSNRGIIYARSRDYARALEDHDKAIELMPSLGEAYINRGNVYFHTGKYTEALADYEKAIKLDAQPSVTGWYNKALTLIKLKRFDEARAAVEQALKFAPNSEKIKQTLTELDGS